MSRQNKRLFTVIMVTALLQMAQFALTPGIAKINTEVFPNIAFWKIQSAITLPSLLSTVMSLISALFIGKKLLSKKACVVIGISLMALTGFVVLIAHTQFWQLCLLSTLIGSGMGFFIAPSASIMFDNFNEGERRLAVGYQTSVINFGGIVMSIGGGFLATLVWYGGYLMLLLAIPVAILCMTAIPNDKKAQLPAQAAAQDRGNRSKIPTDVFYYGITSFFFLLIYNVCGTNISSHLEAAGIGNTATAGIATAVQMAGGVASGFAFNKLSAKFKDLLIPASFIIISIGFTIVSLGQRWLLVDLIGVFIVGTAISIFVPQALFSTSNRVDASNSAASAAIVNCILPGLGGFLSPVVFTNLSTALGGGSTDFRFGFVGIVSLVFGIGLVITTRYRAGMETAETAAA
jgi:MFS family permease